MSTGTTGETDGPIVVAGAGPAGLTAAYELVKNGVPAVVLEADPEYVGGIARTVSYKGYRFDLGGHRFFSKSQEINDLWDEILGDELLTRGRLSRIYYRGRFFDYPIKPLNALMGLGLSTSVAVGLSYLWAQAAPIRPERSFEDWVVNRFGRRLFTIFFKTYTEKVWGIPTTEISADWAAQRIKGLSLLEAVRNALAPPRPGSGEGVIKTLIEEFRYPRYGPGQMWETCARHIEERGGKVEMGHPVTSVHHDGRRVTKVCSRGSHGGEQEWKGPHFVSSLPLRHLVKMMEPAAPSEVLHAAKAVGYRDFLTVALVVDMEHLFEDNWIYIHDPRVKLGRVQNFKNWSPYMVPDPSKTCLGLEYFCFEGDGLWTSSDEDLIRLGSDELEVCGLVPASAVLDGRVVRVKKAYPVYDDGYEERVGVIRRWLEGFENLHVCGRNGMHKYNNQDHSMMTALLAARNILGQGPYDVWCVNTDAEYHESGEVPDRGRQVPRRL